MCLLRKDIEFMKCQKASTESAIERAISRGVSILGGKYKVLLPETDGLNQDLYKSNSSNYLSTSNLSINSWKNVSSQVSQKSRLICPEENHTSVSFSDSEAKKKENNCKNYQFG